MHVEQHGLARAGAWLRAGGIFGVDHGLAVVGQLARLEAAPGEGLDQPVGVFPDIGGHGGVVGQRQQLDPFTVAARGGLVGLLLQLRAVERGGMRARGQQHGAEGGAHGHADRGAQGGSVGAGIGMQGRGMPRAARRAGTGT